jgi:uncharacterized protein (TIRG00374 family)
VAVVHCADGRFCSDVASGAPVLAQPERRHPDDTPVTSRKLMILVLRIAVSLIMLVVLVTQVPDFEASEILPAWDMTHTLWLLGAILLTLLGVVLSAVRWQQVLHALDERVPLRPLLSYYFAAQFVSNVLPTTIGGDVMRVNRLRRQQIGDGAVSFASVVIERLTGWLVLPLMTAIGLLANPGLRELGTASAVAALTACVTLLALVVILWLGAHEKAAGRYAEHEDWRRFLGSVHLGLAQLRRHPRDTGTVILAALAYQMVVVLAAFMAAQAIGIDEAGLTAMLTFIPIVLVLQVLPIGISGLGIREAALVLFLRPLGVPDTQAIALGLLLYLLNLLVSLLGAPAFAFGGSRNVDKDDVLAET